MSLIILSTIVNSVKESIEKFLLAELGNITNQNIKNHTHLDKNTRNKYIPKINNLKTQTSIYGKMIPILYGTMRIAGNIIWMDKIKTTTDKEIVITNNPNKNTNTQSSIQYQYYTNLAIAICVGHVKKISKIWVNTQQLDLSTLTYRLYPGTEDQNPDPLILRLMGNAPAYRGLSYIVIENFSLTDYKNHIPNFTFEVTAYPTHYINQEHAAQRIKSIHIIPGSGEFSYDTIIQMKTAQQKIGTQSIPYGKAQKINNHSNTEKADALISLDQLQEALPNIKWISVVINWYADSLNIKNCNIYPAVEFTNAITTPDNWQVAGINRETARQIFRDIDNSTEYGGTINDQSLIRYINELKTRGYKVLLSPILLIDIKDKPWRGNLTGNFEDISTFFNNQYNPFIKHYANLTQGMIDAFIIGSQLIGLTRITNNHNQYPAVDELVKLANYVKNQTGNSTIVTYAADWREYHSHNGDYNMDKLWASEDIDVIGIDAYFPLTDTPQPINGFTEQDIINGWNSGEGYNYFYKDPDTKQERILYNKDTNQYAWKQIEKWWNQYHINTDNTTTHWIPKSKKIWFTQYGFPSIDNCTSQPNIFIEYQYNQNKYPTFSAGYIDFHAQKIAIRGTIEAWDNSDMVEQMFLWGWDVRPYPYFPQLQNIWQDAKHWQISYWIQEKLSLLKISDIIHDLLASIEIPTNQIKIQDLDQVIEGYALTEVQSTKSILNTLKDIYQFEIVEQEDKLIITSENQLPQYNVPVEDIVSENKNNLQKITKITSAQLVTSINFMYINKNNDYRVTSQYVNIPYLKNTTTENIHAPIVLSDNQAKTIAENILNKKSNNKYNFYLTLPIKYVWLNVNDVIQVEYNNLLYKIKIINIYLKDLSINIEGVIHNYSLTTQHFFLDDNTYNINPTEKNSMYILDLPCIHNIDNVLYFAITSTKLEWKGSILYSYEDQNEHYKTASSIDVEATIGITADILGIGPIAIPDRTSKVTITLDTQQLDSIESLFINNNNLALIGNEIIQFQDVKQIGQNKYQLSNMLRGRFGTEQYINQHKHEEFFVLLDNLPYLKVSQSLIKKSLTYKLIKKSIFHGEQLTHVYYANNLRPLAVTHVKGQRDIYNNLTISWIRRTRINGEWKDNIDTPIDEKFESYDIEILDNYNIIKRTITIKDNTTYIYSAEQQKIDFNFIQEKINIRIYQNSDTVGRGNVYKVTL
ncbi:glycoside hydrolase TIM-barrel-like domain-containing protein [Ehrlichia sp. JZT12]